MKKILALILLVSCILTLCSCGLLNNNKDNNNADNGSNNTQTGGNTSGNNTPNVDTAAVAAIQSKIDASKPASADISVALEAVLDDLFSEYNVTYNEDGTANVVYTYEKFNSFDEDSDEYKSTYTGTVIVGADGTLTGDVDNASVEALTFDINLDVAKLATVEVVSGVLTATIKAANTASVLGVNLGSDASVVVSTNASSVVFIAISYNSVAGPVEIIATYNYSAE